MFGIILRRNIIYYWAVVVEKCNANMINENLIQ